MGNSNEPIDDHFRSMVESLSPRESRGKDESLAGSLLELFEAQAKSRHLDFAARRLGSRGLGYYSIGSSGHESNAAVAAASRPTDPALPHYRSGGFYLRRAAQKPGHSPLYDVLLGVVAAAAEPISAGRHKVFGHGDLAVLPQTSTIASHLPRAVGLAFSLARATKLGVEHEWARDSIVVCSFGDASANHSSATGAINSALHCAYQRIPMPLLLVCEDNGIGISVPSPSGWIESTYRHRSEMPYYTVDGDDPIQCLKVSQLAVNWVRRNRAPAFLHLRTVRLMGHAGSDVESAYRAQSEITADYARDPLLATATVLTERGIRCPREIIRRYEEIRTEVAETVEEVITRPKLASADEVMSAITAPREGSVHSRPHQRTTSRNLAPRGREESTAKAVTLAQALNLALAEELAQHNKVVVFGEDVATKGGVYGVTRGLRRKFGAARVFDTLLDEQSVLGTALGAGLAGLLPIPEIQYLAYWHNASDQLRGEASTLSFFSNGRYRNPMVVRIAGLAYQKGFGGHFHNDNSVAALRDIPGVILACPARPEDAAAMLRTCASVAYEQGRVCVFLEPIALYHVRDLYTASDGNWLGPSPHSASAAIPIGRAREYGTGTDLTLVTFGNGLPMSLRVSRRLGEHGLHARVLDLRWLAPLPGDDLWCAANATGRVLVVDETRRSGGVSESVITALIDHGFHGEIGRVTSEDSFIPLGAAAYHVLLDEDTIFRAAIELSRR